MKKLFLAASVLSLCALQLHAQENPVTIYMANSGDVVSTKEQADFIRTILPPNQGDKDVSTVLDYYLNGNKKLVAHTKESNDGNSEALYGSYIEYFKNGNRKSFRNYQEGKVIGEAVHYFSNKNGSEYYVTANGLLIRAWDLEGNVTVENGNGTWTIYNDDLKVIAAGPIVKGKQEGVWTGTDANGVKQIGVYHDGKLVSGDLFSDDNSVYENNLNLSSKATYLKGDEKFAQYLSYKLRYPNAAKAARTEGAVIVNFIVEKDGTLSNINVNKPISEDFDKEAVRLIAKSGNWKPGYLYGAPRRVAVAVPINFVLPEKTSYGPYLHSITPIFPKPSTR